MLLVVMKSEIGHQSSPWRTAEFLKNVKSEVDLRSRTAPDFKIVNAGARTAAISTIYTLMPSFSRVGIRGWLSLLLLLYWWYDRSTIQVAFIQVLHSNCQLFQKSLLPSVLLFLTQCIR